MLGPQRFYIADPKRLMLSKNHDWQSCGILPMESLTHRYTCDAMSGQTPDALDPHKSCFPNRF